MKIKSFTLIEIILALVVSSIIASYVIKEKYFANYLEAVKTTQDTVTEMVNVGIVGNTGYASARGGNCSDNYDFTDMTSKKLALCNDWNDDIPATTNDRFEVNTVSGALRGDELMGKYGGCNFETKVLSANSNKFYVFIDCSSVKYNSKTVMLMEESLSFVFENTLSSIFVNIEHKATSLNDAVPFTGDNSGTFDGKFRVEMEL